MLKNIRIIHLYAIGCAIVCGGLLIFNVVTLESSFQHYINIKRAPGDSFSPNTDSSFLRERATTYVIGSAASLLLLIIVGNYLVAELDKKRKRLIDALNRLKAGDEQSAVQDDDPEFAAAFNSLADSLSSLDRDRKQWIADTSHELRTPIAVLRAKVEAFQDGVQTITPRNLEVLHGEIMALSKLVDDLHWLSKHDVGQIKTNSAAVDVGQTLEEIIESFEQRRAAKEIKVENLLPSNKGLIVDVDPARIRQVFTNLIENSLRYTNKGGTLRISHEVKGLTLKIYFDDSEPGVPDDILTRIFDRFFRVEPSRNRSAGGSGLGLAICLNNMQMLGGTIEAGKSPLGGLRIELTLPMVDHQQ